MRWEISAEIVSAIMLCIILSYSLRGHLLPTLKNVIFQYCLMITFVSIISNILSTLMLEYVDVVPLFLNHIVLFIYYMTTPLMGAVYFVYALASVYEKEPKKILHYALICSTPSIIYFLLVLTNPFTHVFFTLDGPHGYTRGDWIFLTYIIFYIYVLLSVIFVLTRRKNIDKTVCHILVVFPIISSAVILFQYCFPTYILTGTAATSSLLIIYLYLQNRQMFTDTLTNLLNRQEFNKALAMRIHEHKDFVVMVVSLCDFKFINDKFGQEVGDYLLLELCQYLKQLLPGQFIYRYGGDEFALLCTKDKVKQAIHEINQRMQAPWKINHMDFMINYVIGIVEYPHVAGTQEEIIKGLEIAVSTAKKDKEEKYCICSEAMMQQLQRRYEIVNILKEGIAKDSFQVMFQPIYDVKAKRYRKAEALLRLPENPLGFVSPEEFIPIAEENGLIGPITYQVLDKACHFIEHILKRDIDFLGVSVNFSIVQFLQDDLEEKVLHIIDQHHIPYEKIRIEITESMLATNYEAVLSFMQHMRVKGIQFLLDDFGTGYSNISYVLAVPFHTIKLDKSLIWAAIHNEKSHIVVKKMSEAFLNIGQHVLAEGIETPQHIQFAVECGCDYLQGYYYARPIPEKEALEVIEHSLIAGEEKENETMAVS